MTSINWISFDGLGFLFRFLPVFLAAYIILPSKYRETILLLGSLAFYAVGEPVYFFPFAGMILVNYWLARRVWTAVHDQIEGAKRGYFVTAVVLDVGLLALCKLLAVFVDSSLLPLGISFFTFKMISYQADLYRGTETRRPELRKTAVYFSMFPQLPSGPIMRYGEGQFWREKNCSLRRMEEGTFYFVLGLAMKVILADRIGILWNDMRMIGFESISTPLAWLGAAAYSLQLYLDFWGYSLMAAGIGVMLGFRFIENFDHPYASVTVSEFYRRWHMTLGTWFRDYVYIPMGGSRGGFGKTARNLMFVWLLTGLWHGSGLNFVIWGLVLGLLIVLEKSGAGRFFQSHRAAGHLYILLVIPLTWVIFAITDLPQLAVYFSRLFPLLGGGVAVNPADIWKYLSSYGPLCAAGAVLCVPGVFLFLEKHRKNPAVVLALCAAFWYSVYLVSVAGSNPFLYLNF